MARTKEMELPLREHGWLDRHRRNIRYEDLPAQLQQVADIIGLDKTLDLAEAFRGVSIFFPMYWHVNYARRVIQEKWDGTNTRDLARELSVSDTFVRGVVSKPRPRTTQTSIIDFEKGASR